MKDEKEIQNQEMDLIERKLKEAFDEFINEATNKWIYESVTNVFFKKRHGIAYLSAFTEKKSGEWNWYLVFKNIDDAYDFLYLTFLRSFDKSLYEDYVIWEREVPRVYHDKIINLIIKRVFGRIYYVVMDGNKYIIVHGYEDMFSTLHI